MYSTAVQVTIRYCTSTFTKNVASNLSLSLKDYGSSGKIILKFWILKKQFGIAVLSKFNRSS